VILKGLHFVLKLQHIGSAVVAGIPCGGVGLTLTRRKVPPFITWLQRKRRSMTIWKNYYLPKSLPEALQALADAPGPARLIAGGTDLLLDLQQGRHPPVHTLIDVTRIPEMTALEIRQDRLFVGGAVPLNQVVGSSLVQRHAQALSEAASLIGGPQVRNTATLGGNVAHALPAGDGTIALLALDALAEVASQQGCRLVPMRDLFIGPGRSALQPRGEVLVGFYLPLRKPWHGSAFQRIMRPQGVAIAILNMAVWLHREADRIVDVHIAVGPSGPTPFRALAAEGSLRSQPFSQAGIERALEALLDEARFRTSPHRATIVYRREMAWVLLEDSLQQAWQRAVEK
jgi:CO/xanthine dehydrogenase FAD-binding subunit